MKLDVDKAKDALISTGSNLIVVGVAASVFEDVVPKIISIGVLILGIILILFSIFNKGE